MTDLLKNNPVSTVDTRSVVHSMSSPCERAKRLTMRKSGSRLALYAVVAVAISFMTFTDAARAQQITTLEQAASEVRSRHKGAQILKAEPRVRSDGSKIFRFRLLTKDGMVKTIKISSDADRSGKDNSRKKRNGQ